MSASELRVALPAAPAHSASPAAPPPPSGAAAEAPSAERITILSGICNIFALPIIYNMPTYEELNLRRDVAEDQHTYNDHIAKLSYENHNTKSFMIRTSRTITNLYTPKAEASAPCVKVTHLPPLPPIAEVVDLEPRATELQAQLRAVHTAKATLHQQFEAIKGLLISSEDTPFALWREFHGFSFTPKATNLLSAFLRVRRVIAVLNESTQCHLRPSGKFKSRFEEMQQGAATYRRLLPPFAQMTKTIEGSHLPTPAPTGPTPSAPIALASPAAPSPLTAPKREVAELQREVAAQTALLEAEKLQLKIQEAALEVQFALVLERFRDLKSHPIYAPQEREKDNPFTNGISPKFTWLVNYALKEEQFHFAFQRLMINFVANKVPREHLEAVFKQVADFLVTNRPRDAALVCTIIKHHSPEFFKVFLNIFMQRLFRFEREDKLELVQEALFLGSDRNIRLNNYLKLYRPWIILSNLPEADHPDFEKLNKRYTSFFEELQPLLEMTFEEAGWISAIASDGVITEAELADTRLLGQSLFPTIFRAPQPLTVPAMPALPPTASAAVAPAAPPTVAPAGSATPPPAPPKRKREDETATPPPPIKRERGENWGATTPSSPEKPGAPGAPGAPSAPSAIASPKRESRAPLVPPSPPKGPPKGPPKPLEKHVTKAGVTMLSPKREGGTAAITPVSPKVAAKHVVKAASATRALSRAITPPKATAVEAPTAPPKAVRPDTMRPPTVRKSHAQRALFFDFPERKVADGR